MNTEHPQRQETTPCPLCRNKETRPYHRDCHRPYLCCPQCSLVFVPQTHRLSPEAERAEYDLHTNEIDDPGYRRFLSRVTTPLLERLPPGCEGLDFGCGPGPALAAMMTEAGHTMETFDPHYQNHPSPLQRAYDFITATEVVEHLRTPDQEFERLFAMLRPGGWLGIMTKQVTTPEAFVNWHYIRDLTHICFYSPPVFEYLAKTFNAELHPIATDVVLMRKPLHPHLKEDTIK